MQLSSESAFDHFNHVYDCVKTSFDELRQEASKLFRHPSTSIKWHFFWFLLLYLVSGLSSAHHSQIT